MPEIYTQIEKHDPVLTRSEFIPGGKLYDIINGIMNLNKIDHIKNIVIRVGGIQRDHPEKVLTNLIEIHNKIYEITPHTKVYHSNIIPRLNDNTLPGICFINSEMEKFCIT